MNSILKMIASAFLICIASGVSAKSYNELPAQTITDEWIIDYLGWQDRSDRTYFALNILTNESGALILCGAIQFHGKVGGKSRRTVSHMILRMGQKRAVHNFSWMPVVKRSDDLIGQKAACREYPKVIVPGDASFGIDLSKKVY